MIEYAIIVNHDKDQKIKPQKVTPKDPNYKSVVFERALRGCNYHVGERVKIRNTSMRGNIEEIVKDINQISWENNRPFFVVVNFDETGRRMCNPTQLKRSKI